jgi:SAM-dependent methyltransferase
MKRSLQPIQHLLRETHLLNFVQYVRYICRIISLTKPNRAFIQAHPQFKLPPKYLAFDAYTAPDWEYYHASGVTMAADIADLIKRYRLPVDGIRVLEWGCGPARVIRHLPDKLGSAAQVLGSDYNHKSIQWARNNIGDRRVQFFTNQLEPPLSFAAKTFDFVYALSVFTHLSAENCLKWICELDRVLKDDGLLFFTTMSDALLPFLLRHERQEYLTKGVCVRGKIKEGTLMFLNFHSPGYVRNTLLKDLEVLEHVTPGGFRYIHVQDAWLAGKRKRPETVLGL